MNQPNRTVRPAVLRRSILMSPACLLAVAALYGGGCEHHHYDRDEVVVRGAPPPPPPVVQETVVEEPVYTPPPVEVVTVYERDLNPYGHWVVTANYGRCWVPNDRPAGWRPYTCGHWVSSDQGWVWVAEDDDVQFGEVCYHYGRWYEDPSAGWIWVPGSVWAPSWCAWREGGGYCAWAPLPPQCVDGSVINVTIINQYVPPDRYYVVNEKYITEPRVDRQFVVNNVTIINRTKNITKITYINNQVVNKGVSVDNVARRSGRPVERVQVTRVTSVEDARKLVASGRPAVYAPAEIERFHQDHPVKLIQPTRRAAGTPANTPHVDQKTAEELRVEQEHGAAPVNPPEHVQKPAVDERRVVPVNPPEHVQKPAVDEKTAEQLRVEQEHRVPANPPDHNAADQKAAEDARLRAVQEQKAAQDHAAAEKAAADKALQEKTAEQRAEQEKAAAQKNAAEKAAAENAAAQRAAAEKAAAEQAAAQRAAAERAAEQKAAEEKAAAEKAAHDKAGQNQNKNGQKPGDPNNPNAPH